MSYTPLSTEKKKEICSALGLPEHFADAPQCGRLISKCGELAQENKELQRKATMYEFMAEYMEKADEFWCYFEWIKENYPDEFVEAGGVVDSDEEEVEEKIDMEKEESLLKAQIEGGV